MSEVCFPDGTVVRGTALASRDVNAGWRDRGLYLDARWSPTWPAEIVDWPDLGTPSSDVDAAAAIRRAFEHARSGANVEVGCVAGQGRTGTVLACMAVLAGIPEQEAVTWVRRHYSPGAVETSAQSAWVLWFADRAAGNGWIVTGTP